MAIAMTSLHKVCLSVLLAWSVSGCTAIRAGTGAPADLRLQIDGISLASEYSDTSREVIALLGLGKECRHAGPTCAERILNAPGTVRPGTRALAAAEQLYRHVMRTGSRQPQDGWLDCAQHTDRYLRAADLPGRRGAIEGRSQLALRLHNACIAGLLTGLGERDPLSPVRLRWDVNEDSFPRAAVQRLVAADSVTVSGLRTRQYEDGLGVAAVAVGAAEHAIGSFPAQPFALPVNVRFEPEDETHATLVVSDASVSRSVPTAFGPMALARDVTAAYALAAVEFEREESAWHALRGGAAAGNSVQLRVLMPRDDHKTPVILIHGLASSPMTWVNVANELLGDPDISENYQVWLMRYATGLPLLVNRQLMARRLDEFRGSADRLVLVGHSMGGVLARLLATDSGEALWNAAFATGPEQLQGNQDDIDAARALFVFEAVEGVDELVFVAAPHGGSAKADSVIGKLVRSIIHLPPEFLQHLVDLARANPEQVRPEVRESYLKGGPKSLDTLSPNQPVIRAARQLPVRPSVEIHSIIGIRDPSHPEEGDGIVSLESARWPAGSEVHIPGGHELHGEPATTLELKRILLERLDRLRSTDPGRQLQPER